MDPPKQSKNSQPEHTTGPVLSWFGRVTMTTHSRHGKHGLISRMSQNEPWRSCQSSLPREESENPSRLSRKSHKGFIGHAAARPEASEVISREEPPPGQCFQTLRSMPWGGGSTREIRAFLYVFCMLPEPSLFPQSPQALLAGPESCL